MNQPPQSGQPPQGWEPGNPPAPSGQYLQQPPPPRKKNWFARHKILSALIAFVVIAIIASVASKGGSTSTADPSGTTQPSAAQSTSASAGAKTSAPAASTSKATPKKASQIGVPVRDGKFEFTVSRVRSGVASVGDNEFLTEKAQGAFTMIYVSVKNIGDKPQTLFDDNQKLYDGDGRSFSPDSSAELAMTNNDTWLKEINPGNMLTGVLVYDLPTGAVPTRMELHDSLFSGGVDLRLR